MQTQTVVITGASAGHDRSPQLWLAQHARTSSGVVAGAIVAGARLARQLGRR